VAFTGDPPEQDAAELRKPERRIVERPDQRFPLLDGQREDRVLASSATAIWWPAG